tara:strand:- start:2667 stop:3287 length:621 start_codon:yes stop_codon:yes gene_type:complete
MNILMSSEQIDSIYSYLDSNDIMLEYGSGGSTLHFSKYVKYYYSIEHHKDWYDKVKSETSNITNLSYFYIAAEDFWNDEGSLSGKEILSESEYKRLYEKYPYSEENSTYSCIGRYNQFKTYVNYISELGVETFDKVLIDGRARTFCAYKVLPYLKENSLVFIDDFFRNSYSATARWEVEYGNQFFDLYEQVERVDKLLIAKKKVRI